ncbi:hypothetical protein MBANPS3_011967 [Mucor bainieri]
MPFFPTRTKDFYDQTLKDLTPKHVALGAYHYLPRRINFTEKSTAPISQYSCYLYLNLLTRFINITKDLSEHDLKVYLVRAEYRYFRFMGFVENGGPPPLEVAIFMQAHKAHPYQFEDDCNRDTSGTFHTHFGMNLQETIESVESIIEAKWSKNMEYKEPFYLKTKDLMVGSAEITCVVCFINIEVKWRDFAEWRTDAAALQCNHCKSVFTRHHIGKTNLILDLRKSMDADDSGDIKSAIGKLHLKIKKYIRSIHDIQALPFNSGLDAIKDYLVKNRAEAGLEDDGSIDEFIEAAKQSYFQSPYIGTSFDLLKAVAEQYRFLYKVTQEIQWKRSDFLKMIDNYEYYLELSKRSSNVLVPDIRTDIARHVHMISATLYRKTTLTLCGRVLDHNTAIPQGLEMEYTEITQKEWNLSKAKRMQNKATVAVGYLVNSISGDNKIQAPASELVHQYHKYETNEASYYQKDGFKDFENMRFMSDYMTKRTELLDSSVMRTNGRLPELTVKRAKSFPPYYPFSTDNPSFNWRDANKAWSKAFKEARNYNYTKTRLYENKSFIGSMLIDFEIIFSNEIAFEKREMEEQMQAINEARRIKEYKSRKAYKSSSNGGQQSTSGAYSTGSEQNAYYNGFNDYASYSGCDTTNDSGGNSGGCNDSSGATGGSGCDF